MKRSRVRNPIAAAWRLGNTFQVKLFSLFDRAVTRILLFFKRMRGIANEDQFFEVYRYAIIGERLSGLIHELGQPIHATATLGAAGKRIATKLETDEGVKLASWFKDIETEMERAGVVLQQMRKFRRPSSEGEQRVDVVKLVETVLVVFSPALVKRGVTISTEYPTFPEEAPLMAALEERSLLVAVASVMDNSVRAFAAHSETGTFQVKVENTRDQVSVVITDSGEGIPVLNRPWIFRPGFSTWGRLGVGLPISQRLLDKVGAKIQVSAAKPKGVSVRITLPRAVD